jgi:predicted ATP-grasp superfamily ATP-dependent carboligase
MIIGLFGDDYNLKNLSNLKNKVMEKNKNVEDIINIKPSSDPYIDEIEFSKCDIIIPMNTDDAYALNNRKYTAVISPNDVIEKFDNKKLFYNYCVDKKLTQSVPKTYGSLIEIVTSIIKPNKLIKKPNNMYSGIDCKILGITDIISSLFGDNVIQEYLENNYEYCTFIVANKGKITYSKTYRYYFDEVFHIKNKETSYELDEVNIDTNILSKIEEFLTPCDYHGVLNVDYVILDGNIKIFEINPRFGGSITLDFFLDGFAGCIDSIVNIYLEIN